MRNKIVATLVISICLILLVVPHSAQASSTEIVVDTTVDSNAPGYQACTDAPNDCSLRGAITLANNNLVTVYTIQIPAGTYTLTLAGRNEDENATGDLDIRRSMILQGNSMANTILQAGPSKGNGIDRVLDVPGSEAGTVQVSKLTIQHGEIEDDKHGAGMSIENSSSSVVITQVNFKDNFGEGYSSGGGLFTQAYTEIFACTFTGNEVGGEGGAIYQVNSLLVSRTTMMNNSAKYGGGLANQGTVELENVTISGNTASSSGGGISQWNAGDLTIRYTTIANNSVTGNNSGWVIQNARTFKAFNSILYAAPGKQACVANMTDGSYNFGSDNSCGSNPVVVIADAMLGTLQDNGGYNWTHALAYNSEAVDAADPGSCLSEDQRGKPRPIDGDGDGTALCDVGAYELMHHIFLPLAGN